ETYDINGQTHERWYDTWIILADSLIEGTVYFVLESRCDSVYADQFFPYRRTCYPGEVATGLLRYDDSTANLVEYPTTSDPGFQVPWGHYRLSLDAPCGSTQLDDAGFTSYFVACEHSEQWFNGTSTGGMPNTVKTLTTYSAIPTSYGFAYDVGLLSYGFNEGGGTSRELVYARVGDQEYGEFNRISTESAPGLSDDMNLVTYPNPSHGGLTLSYTLAMPGRIEARMVDVLGREQTRFDVGVRGVGSHTETLADVRVAPGPYVVLLLRDGVRIGRAQVVVL
ncbi:MAG: hypothetical protein AAF730_08815, partial [Bacteroidota bacterium]